MLTLATSREELTHWKRPLCWEGLGAGGEGEDRGWDGWMASPTRCTWIWVNSRSWWWTGRPGVLRFMGLQRVGHDWATELHWTEVCVSEDYRMTSRIWCHLTSNPEKAMAPYSSILAWKIPWTEEPGRLQSMGSLGVRHDWVTSLSLFISCIGEGNGNPLQCSCLENLRDGGAWWAAVSGVAQSRTWLKQLSSSSNL